MTSLLSVLRAALLLLVALGLPLGASAQQPQKIPKLGVLFAGIPSRSPQLNALWEELRSLGYVDGKNIVIELRAAEARIERLPELAAELVALKPDVIVAATPQSAQAAKKATRDIPIVMAVIGDPIRQGLVESLASPGGNVTGMSLMAPELAAKQVELFRESIPSLQRLAFLWNELTANMLVGLPAAERAARSLNIDFINLPVRKPEDLQDAFARASERQASGLIVQPDTILYGHRQTVAELAIKAKLPTFVTWREEVVSGAMIGYGPDLNEQYQVAAHYVHKILNGAKLANLPVQQSSKFKTYVNLKTAAAIGIELQPSILLRADEIIE